MICASREEVTLKEDHMSYSERHSPPERCPVRRFSVNRAQENGCDPEDQSFLRKTKGTLNKMTMKNVDTISSQLLESFQEIKKITIWKEVTKVIYQRAIMEPNFVNMYICFCAKIGSEVKMGCGENGEKPSTFGDVMVCVYDEEMTQRMKQDTKDEELQEANKQKMLAGTKFIGELSKKGVLPSEPLLDCLEKFLSRYKEDTTTIKTFAVVDMACIECVCTLLTMVGKKMDWISERANQLNSFYQIIGDLSQNRNLLARIRFMAKDLDELRGNKWLPRVLTKEKKVEETTTTTTNGNINPPNTNQGSNGNVITEMLPATMNVGKETPKNESCAQNAAPPSISLDESNADDPELNSMFDALLQKIKKTPEAATASSFKKFLTALSPEQAKVFVKVAKEANAEVLASPWTKRRASLSGLLRRSSSQIGLTPPASPPTLSKNFHAAINLVKLNNEESFSEDMGNILQNKVESLKASELLELVCSIFRKMCETPEEYPFCLVLFVRLSSTEHPSSPQSFKELLEACCQDESALRMFNTQGALNLYMQMLKDLEKNIHTDKKVIKTCIGHIQQGLYELSESEIGLLGDLESLCEDSTKLK